MNRRHHVLPVLIVSIAAALLSAWARGRSQQPTPPAGPTAPGVMPRPSPTVAGEAAVVPAPLPPGPAPDLNLVFTAQVAGWIEPCG